MLKRKWKSGYGAPLLAITAALALAACDSDRVSDARDTAEQTVGQNEAPVKQNDVRVGQNQAPTPPNYNASDNNLRTGEAVTQTDPVAGLENPFELTGHSIETADGEKLGEITQLVTDDAENVYAVIEMAGADKTPEASGSMVVDVDKIDRSRDDLVLMSQDADLEPYVPENYKPLGVRTEP